jgi:2-succinyl-6-hydroxy-2,4-cyclohexadiene-1-carboxylate synthase
MVHAVPHVVALHGFAGTGRAWDAVDPAYLAPDLPGHGRAAAQHPVTFAGCVAHVLAEAPERFTLTGYSMGGRIALHVALAAPERVERLVLISSSAGIADPVERAARRAADEALAAEVEAGTIEDFAERWMALELFAGDPPETRERWREDILRNEPGGLAAALRGVGAGAMEPLWERLGELAMPITVMAGERDAKFRALAGQIASRLRGDIEVVVVPGAGHGLPRETPRRVADAISCVA